MQLKRLGEICLLIFLILIEACLFALFYTLEVKQFCPKTIFCPSVNRNDILNMCHPAALVDFPSITLGNGTSNYMTH